MWGGEALGVPVIGGGQIMSISAIWQGTDHRRSRHQGLYNHGVLLMGLSPHGVLCVESC